MGEDNLKKLFDDFYMRIGQESFKVNKDHLFQDIKIELDKDEEIDQLGRINPREFIIPNLTINDEFIKELLETEEKRKEQRIQEEFEKNNRLINKVHNNLREERAYLSDDEYNIVFNEEYRLLQEDEERRSWKIYKVQKGDTLLGISRKFNINHLELARINNIKDINRIYIGQELKIRKVKEC